jgi:hypothetical protein
MEETMKKIFLAAAIAAMVSSAAFAQSSQGQGGAQAGVNGNGANAPDSTMQNDRMRDGTTWGALSSRIGRGASQGSRA